MLSQTMLTSGAHVDYVESLLNPQVETIDFSTENNVSFSSQPGRTYCSLPRSQMCQPRYRQGIRIEAEGTALKGLFSPANVDLTLMSRAKKCLERMGHLGAGSS